MRLLAVVTIVVTLAAGTSAKFVICCSAENDLYRALPNDQTTRVDTPTAALDAASDGGAVLILADGYPEKKTDLPNDFYDRAARKNLRLYIEYPSAIPGALLGDPPRTIIWERGVVASDYFSPALKKLRIVMPQDCHFLMAKADHPHLVIARVAGFDTAVYGLAKENFPLLFDVNEGKFLIATTKLSNFVTARYAPAEDWKIIWRTILHKLDPDHAPPELNVIPVVTFAYGRDDKTPPTLERDTYNRAAAFYTHARLLITKERQPHIHELLRTGKENDETPQQDVEGDGSLGMLEGYSSAIRYDGAQLQRTPIRSDCNAEAAAVLSLSSNDNDHKIASNLLDYVFGPEMESMGRSDPKHPAYGLIAWGAISNVWKIGNYGDDDARVILSAITASAAQKTDRWNEPLMRALLANLRTTGTQGFRGDRVDIGPLEQLGWKHFHDAPTYNPAPHFESYLWACYLWAYRQTGEREFLDKTKNAIKMSMDAYAKHHWRWMDNIERARMLLCLSWLVRLEDTPEHRNWLTTVARDLLDAQQECGAIQERRGSPENTGFQIPQSNEAYGTSETPLIQNVGDPATDQLYTTGFALLGLHEAFAATHDATLKKGEDKLADFLCRIQTRSTKLPYLDGTWFRAFDYQKWDYWASSADAGWGVWSVEAGWAQAWTAITLALRQRQTSLWDMTPNVAVKEKLDLVREKMKQNDGAPFKR